MPVVTLIGNCLEGNRSNGYFISCIYMSELAEYNIILSKYLNKNIIHKNSHL